MHQLRKRFVLGISMILVCQTAFAADCTSINVQNVPNVDMQKVQDTWLGWNNDLRQSLNLPAYALDGTLNLTAANWSLYSVKRGTINHKRYEGSPYYDYKASEKWFENFGLSFLNKNSMTFTENIGWGPYSCSKKDCTDELLAAIRTTFDFYTGEKGKLNDAHYLSLVNPQYKIIGVGIAVSEKQKRYYLTVHYATAFSSTSGDVCVAAR